MKFPEPLAASFYQRPVLEVARALLGKRLVRDLDGRRLVGRIVETEAYAGRVDPSSHSYRGITPRCRTMFGPRGRAYLYFTYGNHHCFNVTAGAKRLAGAVLVRAVEPLEGIPTLRDLRVAATRPGQTRDRLLSGESDRELTNGPGKLAAAFGLDLTWDDHDLTTPQDLWVGRGPRAVEVRWTPRVGLGQNPAAPWHWRCIDLRSRSLTRLPRSWPTAPRPRPTLEEVCGAHSSTAS